MAKHRKPRVIEVGADYGPAMIRDCDGRLRATRAGAAAGIELAEVPDIDRPDKRVTVRVRGVRTRSSVGNPDTLGFKTMPRAGAALGR
jgi:hypothetical protein